MAIAYPSVSGSNFNLWVAMYQTPYKASVVIPSLGREDMLERCLESLRQGDEQKYETIIIREKGELAHLRNEGWKRSQAPVVCFIDDDTLCTTSWLSSILRTMDLDGQIAGVSGPSVIPDAYKGSRDLFRFKVAKSFYDWFFCEGKEALPGHICRSGAWTTGASLEACSYEGEVDFLEACNQSYRKVALQAVGGFDEHYRGVGDWSEPDLCYRLKEHRFKLHFTQGAKLYHLPSQTGAYSKRLHDNTRYQNYRRFASRWVRPNWKHGVYLKFLEGYFLMKRLKLV